MGEQVSDRIAGNGHAGGDDRAARIERALAERLGRADRGIPKRAGSEAAPLSFVQQALWLTWKLEGGGASTSRPSGLRFRGSLDLPALEWALSEVQRRHGVLRSTFAEQDGVPTQRLVEPSPIALQVTDLSRLPEEHRLDEAERLATAFAEEPFDLENEAPFRNRLLRLASDDHVLVMALDHIVMDGWSERILHHEVQTLYDARLRNSGDIGLAPLPIQYADYAAWQAARSSDAALERQLEFWRQQLADLPDDLHLPTDGDPVGADTAGGPVALSLDAELVAGIRGLARDLQATPFMALLAGLQVLLARLGRQDDLVVGVSTAGRTHPELEPLLGCFINTLPIRARIGAAASFRDVVGQARDRLVTSLANQDLPYSRLVAEFRPWGSADHRPLFQVSFQMRNFPTFDTPSRPELEITDFPIQAGPMGHQLAIRAAEVGDGIEVLFDFDERRFRRASVERWAGHLRTLLSAAVADSDRDVWDLPLLDAEERKRIVVDFNTPSPVPDRGRLPHERFVTHATRHPDTIAYRTADKAVTYGEFAERTAAIAGRLHDIGAARERCVAVYMDVHPDTTAAILGVLRSGAAFVPIDPTAEREWLSDIVTDAGCFAILTHRSRVAEVPDLGVPVLAVEDVMEPSAGTGLPGVVVQDADLAYVMYTSGSTGRPKGVMVEHGSLARFVEAAIEAYGYAPGSRVLQHHSIAFDGSIKNYLPPLAAGSTLVGRSESGETIDGFLEWCDVQGVTHVHVPTSYFRELTHELVQQSAALPPSVERIGIGGEQVGSDVVDGWLRHIGPSVMLINSYGPTEATVSVTIKELHSAEPGSLSRIPIGKPAPPGRLYVLDSRNEPVPIGVPGELCIGGPQVARGYLGQATLTGERFTPDPVSTESGDRIFRTGDLARWLANGDLEFLGRLDRQVKIRGFRVEPEAVESVMRQHVNVRDAAVIARPGPGGWLRLLAYVVLHHDDAASGGDVAAFVRGRLPDFMVPASVTIVAELPMNGSGKLDADALPDPVDATAVSHVGSERSPLVEIVAAVWADVLEIDHIPDGVGFFELGGHSLLAIRVMARLRERLGVDLALVELFTNPTLEAFAAVVGDNLDGDIAEPIGARTEVPKVAATGDLSNIDGLLVELDRLSDDEAAALLAELDASGGGE